MVTDKEEVPTSSVTGAGVFRPAGSAGAGVQAAERILAISDKHAN